MPDPAVTEIHAFIERLLDRSSTTSDQEIAMRTQLRDTLIAHIDHITTQLVSSKEMLQHTEPRRITQQMLEDHVNDIITRVDAIFVLTQPSVAAAATGSEE